jgi:hypothetical protein
MSTAPVITYQQLGPSAPMSNTTESAVSTTGTPVSVDLELPVLMQAGQSWMIDTGTEQETITVIDYESSPPSFTAIFSNAHSSDVALVYVPGQANNDPQWAQGIGSLLTDLQAVAQAILTRLKLFQGEWWASTTDGLPLWQSILGQGASPQSQQQQATLISARINGTPWVINLASVQTSFNPTTRAFGYSATVNTQFGTIVVTNLPTPPSGALPA